MKIRTTGDAEACTGHLNRILFEFWMDLKGGRLAPDISDFNYLERPELVPHMMVLKAPEGGSEFYIKYFGSAIREMIGGEVTGQKFTDVIARDKGNPDRAEFAANTAKIINLCKQTGRPVLNGPRYLTIVPRTFIRVESLTVPFVDGEGNVKQTVSVVDAFTDLA